MPRARLKSSSRREEALASLTRQHGKPACWSLVTSAATRMGNVFNPALKTLWSSVQVCCRWICRAASGTPSPWHRYAIAPRVQRRAMERRLASQIALRVARGDGGWSSDAATLTAQDPPGIPARRERGSAGLGQVAVTHRCGNHTRPRGLPARGHMTSPSGRTTRGKGPRLLRLRAAENATPASAPTAPARGSALNRRKCQRHCGRGRWPQAFSRARRPPCRLD
jgi:hypothetical protein